MFQIQITETKLVKQLAGKEWKTIGTKEVPRDGAFFSNSKDEPKTRIEDVYGYTPEIEQMVEQSRLVLTQSVETLDLAKVIKAINNLE